jgi:hypothetical protein
MADLIDQLRDANPEPHPKPLPVGPMWDKLAAADRNPGRHDRLERISFGQVMSAVSVVVVLGLTIFVAVFVGLSARAHTRLPQRSGSSQVLQGCVLAPQRGELVAVKAILKDVQLLRRPAAPQDRTAAACAADAEAEMTSGSAQGIEHPGRGAHPVDLRYVGPGVLGGQVFMYALPGVPQAIGDRGASAASPFARSEAQPSVCLITVGGGRAGSPSGCTNLQSLQAGPQGFGAAQVPGTATSVLAGVVRDGITAIRVYDRGRLIKTEAVINNAVQFIVDHNAPAAVYLRIRPVT